MGANLYTPNEEITYQVRDHHPYQAAIHYATEHLGEGDGRTVLVVGSPPAEADALHALNWKVTLLDWRPANHPAWVQGDAMHMPFDAASFYAVTSTCVLCHVGLGRYGDPVEEHGDSKMLAEIDRVLAPGGRACLMPGPVITGEAAVIGGSVHRVTTLEAMAELTATWFRTVGRKVFQASSRGWMPPEDEITSDRDRPDYLCLALERV